MIYYVAFDDTDTLDCGRGTGKLARWFADELSQDCKQTMVVRQQLLHSPEVPMTSHNSSLCCVIESDTLKLQAQLISLATEHIKNHFFEGSDPGLCVAHESEVTQEIIDFGIKCTSTKTSQEEARKAAGSIHLSGHGGTNDGIIGAASAVGLTHFGNSGRIVDYADIRELPEQTTVKELRDRNIFPLSINRHAEFIPDEQTVDNKGSLRPHLWNGKLVVPVKSTGKESWEVIVEKKEYI